MPSARRIQWAKFRITVTAFSALLILGVFLALLTGGTVFQPKDAVRVYMPDSTGMGPKTPVRLNGIPIGSVTEVRLSGSPDPNRVVEVILQIEHRYLNQVAADSVATTTSENIQGDKYLDITRGNSAAHVRPGGEVRFQPAPDVLKTLDLAQFESRLRAIDALLADIQAGKGALGELVRKDDLYQDTVRKLAGLQKAMRAATSTQESLGRVLYRDTLYQEILAPITDLDAALARIQRGEGAGGRLIASSEQFEALRSRAGELRQSLAALNAGKGEGGQFLKRDDMYREWNRRVAAMAASVDNLNAGEGGAGRLLRSAEVYESLAGSLREMERNVDDFRRNPHKYLRLSLF